MNRKLIEYLPYVVRDYAEFQGIAAAEQPEFEQAWQDADELLTNQFIMIAGEMGLSRWETILEIVPRGTDSLEDRRFRILSRLNDMTPYTLPQLRKLLAILFGEGKTSADVTEYILSVQVPVPTRAQEQALWEMIDRIKPANIAYEYATVNDPLETTLYFGGTLVPSYTHTELPQWAPVRTLHTSATGGGMVCSTTITTLPPLEVN
ncbi:MAG: DUF2313 domain-containing protein [Butyricicoccus pullicaecorum]|nr:DUF2313 domain-containing protein [Butyricicoccus pullicaecorum]